ncbi:MAG: hypothetical protein ACI4JQ_02935 [Ruminococcus sp.]
MLRDLVVEIRTEPILIVLLVPVLVILLVPILVVLLIPVLIIVLVIVVLIVIVLVILITHDTLHFSAPHSDEQQQKAVCGSGFCIHRMLHSKIFSLRLHV